MANLTKSQKKNRNKFIALMIAIVVVLAAIALVIYNGLTVASFENEDFEKLICDATGLKQNDIKKADLEKYGLVYFYNDGSQMQITLGDNDYLALTEKYSADLEAYETASAEYDTKLNEVKEEKKAAAKAEAEAAGEVFDEEAFNTAFDAEEHDIGLEKPVEPELPDTTDSLKSAVALNGVEYFNLNDLEYFTGVKELTIIGADIKSESVSTLKNLVTAEFSYCRFDNVDGFAALNYDNIEKIYFSSATFDEVSDWSVLAPYGDKIVFYSSYYTLDETGNFVPMNEETTLTELLPVEEAPVEETPVEEAPVEETPVEEVPVEETPVEEVPAEETTTEEVTE